MKKTEEDRLRMLMFTTAYHKLYAEEPHNSVRFAKSILYSAREFTPQELERMPGWRQRLKQWRQEFELTRDRSIRRSRYDGRPRLYNVEE